MLAIVIRFLDCSVPVLLVGSDGLDFEAYLSLELATRSEGQYCKQTGHLTTANIDTGTYHWLKAAIV